MHGLWRGRTAPGSSAFLLLRTSSSRDAQTHPSIAPGWVVRPPKASSQCIERRAEVDVKRSVVHHQRGYRLDARRPRLCDSPLLLSEMDDFDLVTRRVQSPCKRPLRINAHRTPRVIEPNSLFHRYAHFLRHVPRSPESIATSRGPSRGHKTVRPESSSSPRPNRPRARRIQAATEPDQTRSAAASSGPTPAVAEMVESVVGCKWSLHVLAQIRAGNVRPGTLERSAPGLTHKVLSERLAKLLRFGIIERHEIAARPAHVEYRLTPFGERFTRIIDEVDRLQRSLSDQKVGREAPAS